MGGHPYARYYLGGINEVTSERTQRGMKHLVIATNLGHDEALEAVKAGFMDGLARGFY